MDLHLFIYIWSVQCQDTTKFPANPYYEPLLKFMIFNSFFVLYNQMFEERFW